MRETRCDGQPSTGLGGGQLDRLTEVVASTTRAPRSCDCRRGCEDHDVFGHDARGGRAVPGGGGGEHVHDVAWGQQARGLRVGDHGREWRPFRGRGRSAGRGPSRRTSRQGFSAPHGTARTLPVIAVPGFRAPSGTVSGRRATGFRSKAFSTPPGRSLAGGENGHRRGAGCSAITAHAIARAATTVAMRRWRRPTRRRKARMTDSIGESRAARGP